MHSHTAHRAPLPHSTRRPRLRTGHALTSCIDLSPLSRQALRFAETCAAVELSSSGAWSELTAAAALRTLDSQIDAVHREIARKERWETKVTCLPYHHPLPPHTSPSTLTITPYAPQVIRRRDVRAGLAAGMAGLDGAYKTDLEFEEVKVSGLTGAEAEHEELERLLQARQELVGAA